MTTIQTPTPAEITAKLLQATPVGTLVTIDTDETFVRADRSEYPWLLVEDSTTPDSQTWLGHDDVAAHDVDSIVYPANYVAPEAEAEPEATLRWSSSYDRRGLEVTVWQFPSTGAPKLEARVSGVPCGHSHRTIDTAATCGNRRASEIEGQR